MGIEFKRLQSNDLVSFIDCSNSDLNDFFCEDWRDGCTQLISVTYAIFRDGLIVGYFCVSNDSIRKAEFEDKKTRNKFYRRVQWEKQQFSSLPAVKIGRLAIDRSIQRCGIGTEILDVIKFLFINNNKTGCRFIIVDALNNPKVQNFYIKNHFEYLRGDRDEEEDTRLMFFDLITFKP